MIRKDRRLTSSSIFYVAQRSITCGKTPKILIIRARNICLILWLVNFTYYCRIAVVFLAVWTYILSPTYVTATIAIYKSTFVTSSDGITFFRVATIITSYIFCCHMYTILINLPTHFTAFRLLRQYL